MNIFQPFKRYNHYRKVRDELSSCSDRQLHDIGITRDKIIEIAKAAAPR